jgi:hypothetical protein
MSRNNKILIVLFLVLITLFIVIREVRDPSEKRVEFFSINPEMVHAIEISTSSDTLKIVRTDTEWLIGYPFTFDINEARLNRFMDVVFSVESSTQPVSVSEDSHGDFQLTDARATKLQFFASDGRLLDEALIGRSGAFAYARRFDKPDVYQLTDNITFQISPRLSNWRNQYIVAIPSGQIESIDVDYELNSYTISRADTSWTYASTEQNFAIDENNSQLKRVLSKIEAMDSFDYFDFQFEEYEEPLTNPQLTLRISHREKPETHLVFALLEDGNFIVMKNGVTDHLYLSDAETVDEFTKSHHHYQ